MPVDNMRILLLSVTAPNTRYTGALMLHSMFKAVPLRNLSCFAIKVPRISPAIGDEYKDVPYQVINKPPESQKRHLPGKFGSLESFARERAIKEFTIPQITSKVLNFIDEQKPDLIWCTLEGQTMIRIASILQKRLTLPMVTQVWDPPEWWMHDNGVEKWTRSEVLKTFASVLKEADVVATASWSMAEQYTRQFGCRTVPVLPGLPGAWAHAPKNELNDAKTLKIGFAGQMYSEKEWEHLQEALDAVDWTIEGRQVEIVMMGRLFHLSSFHKRNIRYLGWCNQQETLEILSKCDILYCPYWFDGDFESPARLSFPSKLSTYLAAGRPILFHGPEYSSPCKFLKENDAAMLCHGLSKSAILNGLNQLVYDKERYFELAKNGARTFREHLTDDRMTGQFLQALTLAQKEKRL